ncbi:5114_t:CDS:2, partial [Funneliformis mosseae]
MPKTNNTRSKNSQAKDTLPKRISLTLAQKYEICLRKVTEPSIKNKELAVIYNVSEESPEAQGKRQIKVNFPEIEEALTLWVLKALEHGVDI